MRPPSRNEVTTTPQAKSPPTPREKAHAVKEGAIAGDLAQAYMFKNRPLMGDFGRPGERASDRRAQKAKRDAESEAPAEEGSVTIVGRSPNFQIIAIPRRGSVPMSATKQVKAGRFCWVAT